MVYSLLVQHIALVFLVLFYLLVLFLVLFCLLVLLQYANIYKTFSHKTYKVFYLYILFDYTELNEQKSNY